jgi:large subunit ribosomal protein L33
MRVRVGLACSKCNRRNYTVSKNKQTHPDRIVRKKFCRWCGEHTEHKETR